MPDRRQPRNRHRAPSRGRIASVPRQIGERAGEDIHVCPDCASEMVQPLRWAPLDTRRWKVELRCPECLWGEVGVFPQHVLDRYDAILDHGIAALLEDLNRLERANLEDQVERFVSALEADRILPEDF